MENTLVKVDATQYGLQEGKANEIEALFVPMIDKMKELETELKAVKEQEINEETCKAAKDLRLKYVKVRTGTAQIHKEAKASFLAASRCIDGWKNAQLYASQGAEEELKKIENHFENIERERKAKLVEERTEALSKFGDVPLGLNLGEMPDDAWNIFLSGAERSYNERIEAEKKAEEERVAREKKEAEEAEKQRIEQEKIRKENEKLKKEKEAAEKKRQEELAEQKKKEEKAESDRKKKEAAEKKKLEAEKAKRKKLEDEKKQADLKAKQELEAAEKKRKEEKAEQERKLKEQEEKTKKLEADLKAKEDAEKKKLEDEKKEKAEQERKAKFASDKEKLEAISSAINGLSKRIEITKFENVQSMMIAQEAIKNLKKASEIINDKLLESKNA